MKIFKEFIKKKDLIAENTNLKKQLEVEKMKSAYWKLAALGKEPKLVCSKETMEHIVGENLIDNYCED